MTHKTSNAQAEVQQKPKLQDDPGSAGPQGSTKADRRAENRLQKRAEKDRLDRAVVAWNALADFSPHDTALSLVEEPNRSGSTPKLDRLVDLMLALGHVLLQDNWRDRLNDIEDSLRLAPPSAKQLALGALGLASVKAPEAERRKDVRANIQDLASFPLRYQHDYLTWLTRTLKDEILRSQRPPMPPAGWVGEYCEEIATPAAFLKWIDRQLLFHDNDPTQLSGLGSNALVKNAHLLIDKLGLDGMPDEPVRSLALGEELAHLRALKRRHADAAPFIVSHGDSAYSIGRQGPMKLTDPEDAVFQAFLGGKPLKHAELIKESNRENAPTILQGLKRRYDGMFAPAIRMPGGKSSGGYFVAVRRKNDVT